MFVAACSKDGKNGHMQTYTIYSPVYASKSEVLASINSAATVITHAGKMYLKDNFIFLNEVNKGIHVIDNSDPSHPAQIAFLKIPGNLDIAIKGNTLYADMYGDLLALDITDIHHAKITSTINNFFQGRTYVNGSPSMVDDKVAVDWKEKDTAVFVNDYPYPTMQDGGILYANNNGPNKSATGVAGSMASMVLVNNYLYAISEMHSLGIVDVTNAAQPKLDSSFFAGFDLQTVFPFKDKLFLGSAIGMFVYDISDPQNPVSVGQFEHGQACDPVIADGDYAYVTLHAGDGCGGDQNELDVIDIKDITNSQLVKTYQLIKPTGLSKDGNYLFVCDGTEVKIYNALNPSALKLIKQIKATEPYDVIAANNKMMVVTATGLYQYDYSNINNIRQLSFFAANR